MRTSAPAPLPPREAYRLWAPVYGQGNVLTAMEDRTVRALAPELRTARALLDVGCGGGKRLRPRGEGVSLGVDLVFEMLATARERGRIAAADLRTLPFASRAFDAVTCRLVLSCVTELGVAYAELARVATKGAAVVVTDFHPEAAHAGLVRGFTDAAGVARVVKTCVHDLTHHERAARRAGLAVEAVRHAAVGPDVRDLFERAEVLKRYDEQLGKPMVLALLLRA
jgi:malonyl-CoA O-methyltransferase